MAAIRPWIEPSCLSFSNCRFCAQTMARADAAAVDLLYRQLRVWRRASHLSFGHICRGVDPYIFCLLPAAAAHSGSARERARVDGVPRAADTPRLLARLVRGMPNPDRVEALYGRFRPAVSLPRTCTSCSCVLLLYRPHVPAFRLALTLRLCPQVLARTIVRGGRALAQLPERSFDSPAP